MSTPIHVDFPTLYLQLYDDGSVDLREQGTGNMQHMWESSQDFEKSLKAAMKSKQIVSAMRSALEANQRSPGYDPAISAELMSLIHELGYNPIIKTSDV